MPAQIYRKDDFYFGLGYPYGLPEGWTLKESQDDFAIGVSRDGQHYFIGEDLAQPLRIAGPDNECHKEGTRYVDTENGVLRFVRDGDNPTQVVEVK